MRKFYRFFIPILVIVTALNTLRAEGLGGQQLANKTPEKFIPNKGQLLQTNGEAADQVRYYFEGQKASVYFREKGWSYVFSRQKGGNEPTSSENLLTELTKLPSANQPDQRQYYRLDVNLVGANNKATIKGLQKTEPYYNYYIGHCPDGIEKVYTRERIVYEDIYPGTDLVFYFSNGKLKYDFKVKDGQDADHIKLRYQGADDLEAQLTNQLVVNTPMGSFKETIPAVYQETPNGRQFYEGGYKVEGNTVTFQTAQAIKGDGDLVIDPYTKQTR
jgi:hypothetical protein